jgi:hypothetical protein
VTHLEAKLPSISDHGIDFWGTAIQSKRNRNNYSKMHIQDKIMKNFNPITVDEFSKRLSKRLFKKTYIPKIVDVKEQISRREYVKMYKIAKPEHVNFHSLNPKELRSVDRTVVTDAQIKKSPVKQSYNGLNDNANLTYRIRKQSYEREKKGLPKNLKPKKLKFWEKEKIDEESCTEFSQAEQPTERDFVNMSENHSDTTEYKDQKSEHAVENYEFYCKNIQKIKERRSKSKEENPMINFLHAAE